MSQESLRAEWSDVLIGNVVWGRKMGLCSCHQILKDVVKFHLEILLGKCPNHPDYLDSFYLWTLRHELQNI